MDKFNINEVNDANEIDLIQQQINRDLEKMTSDINENNTAFENPETTRTSNEILSEEEQIITDISIAENSAIENAINNNFSKLEEIVEKENLHNANEFDEDEVFQKNKRKPNLKKFLAYTATACAFGVVFGVGTYLGQTISSNFEQTQTNKNINANVSQKIDTEKTQYLNDDNKKTDKFFGWGNELVSVIDSVEPSVVAITSTINNVQTTPFEAPKSGTGKGSGIIYKDDDNKLYIVTNYHVIGGATTVNVSIEGSGEIKATLVGKEPNSDLAVISIDKNDLLSAGVNSVVIAQFGNSDEIQVGEFVVAIGNALGEGNSSTVGIVSAKNKEVNISGTNLKYIQTDAAINPGNSGGPLVNMKGEVVGINTAKLSETSIERTGYSISSNEAKNIIERISGGGGKVLLGIAGGDVSQEIAEAFGLPQMGVFVNEVVPNGSAEKAGIQKGDIIAKFGDKTIMTMKELQDEVATKKVGEKLEITVIRDSKPLKLKVTMQENKNTGF